ncbi:MAG: hypothetical protein IJ863_01140 [Spirochaetales bacterium]|nr:hypothetical protein [Spirochaetales bacterium]
MKLKVSDKHILLRAILTAIFFVIAVVAFTVGVTSIGRKVSGYQLIEGKTDAEALTYNNAVHYKYWLEGSSNQIKRGIRGLVAEYTPVLSAAYKQLDHQNTYTGHVSIGTINRNLGKEVSVSPELYAILQDAYARTLDRKGFNMFAGALYDAWRSILILEDPEDFDPLENGDQARRISAIAEAVNDLDNFSLEFLPDNTVRFSLSEEYQTFCTQYEIDSFALDLNVLKDAYMLQWIGSSMVEKGYRYGYLFTEEGLALNTSDRGTLGYDLYVLENGEERPYASMDLDGVFSATTLTAWGMGSDYGYSIDADGALHFRSEHFNVQTGEFSEVSLSLTVISSDMDLVDTVCTAVWLDNLGSESELDKAARELEGQGVVVSYILQSSV